MDIVLTASLRQTLVASKQIRTDENIASNRLQSGKKVNSAIDDAVKFYKAKGLTDRAEDLTKAKEGIDQGIFMLKATMDGLNSIASSYRQLKGLLQSAKIATPTEKASICKNWDDIIKGINDYATDASYQGNNLLLGGVNDPNGPNPASLPPQIKIQVSDNSNNMLSIEHIAPPAGDVLDMIAGNGSAIFAAGTNVTVDQVALDAGNTDAQITTIASAGAISGAGVWQKVDGSWVVQDSPGHTVSLSNVRNLQEYSSNNIDQWAVASGGTTNPVFGNDYPLYIFTADIGANAAIPAGTYKFATGINNVLIQGNPKYQPITGAPGAQNAASHQIMAPSDLTWYYTDGTNTTTDITFGSPPAGSGNIVNQFSMNTFGCSRTFSSFRNDTAITFAEKWVDAASSFIHAAQSYTGSNITFLQTRMDFNDKLVNILGEGSDKMVLADLNEEAATFFALQTRDQIATQNISITGQQQNNILTLLGASR